MKTIKSIFLLFMMFIAISANGQNHIIGVKGGNNWTNVTATDFNTDLHNQTGITTGVSYNYIFKNHIIVGAEAIYDQRGFTSDITITDENGNPTGQKPSRLFNYDYLTILLNVGFNYGNTFYSFANIGLTPAVLLDAMTETPEIILDDWTIPKERHNVTKQVNKFDIGGIVEIGGGYKFMDKFWPYVSFSYRHSFTTITNSDYYSSSKIRHKGMAINIGLKYALGN